MHIHSMVKVKSQIKELVISQDILFCNKFTRKKFGTLPIIIPYAYPNKIRIGSVVVFVTYSIMEQELHINTSKYGVLYSTLSIDVLQERILITDPGMVVSWVMQLLK